MKIILAEYVFNPASRTVTFPTRSTVELERFLMITNVTRGALLYIMNDVELSGSVAGSTITLALDTTSMQANDRLQIFYDEPQNTVVQGDLNDNYDSVAVRGKHEEYLGLTISSLGDLLPPTDVSSYSEISVHLTNVSPGSFVQFAFSNDSVTWSAHYVTGAASLFVLPRKAKFFKAVVTSYVSGAVSANVALFSDSTLKGAAKVGYPVPDYGSSAFMQDNAGNIASLYSLAGVGDSASGNKPLGVGVAGFDGANVSRLRYASIFKSASATAAGDTSIWTPLSGKRYRVLGFQVYVTSNASQAAAGLLAIKLRDGTSSDIMNFDVFVPGAAATSLSQGWTSGWIPFAAGGGLGFLSGNVNRPLVGTLSAALSTGKVTIVAAGTEE